MDTDMALVMDIRKGDKQALGKLVERHKKSAFRIALGLVGNKDDAFDISQEAFLRVYKSAKTFDTKQPFQPWFYTIIANLSRTWLRRRSRRENRMVDVDDVSWLLVDNRTPEQAVIKNETVANLRQALKELSFDDREIITLQHFRCMSYEEISDLLSIPKGTVMSRLYYARKKLAGLMRQKNGEE
ncbi:MAG: RNA polymerase sigma factor [candidate division Zixibacteria bacterium]|nr:RNA polymerase sigma factor [candidate division Zixibacteria bacterium]MDH3936930.1 RNA polymerase sigma factor [candidate division Zixibacteria bacterium]MDH4032765.1 RNA polymerase sigma factor [candidate division Zixibacteria bacterium]